MKKTYKYELTLVTGETKEFECPYSPEELRISLSGSSYSLKAYGNILYGNVINYKLIEAVEDTTTEETTTDNLENSKVKLCVLMSFFMISIPVIYFLFKAITGFSFDSEPEKILLRVFVLGAILYLVGTLYEATPSKKSNKE